VTELGRNLDRRTYARRDEPSAPAWRWLRRIPWAALALLLYAATALAANVLGFVVTLPYMGDAVYADSYTLYDLREYAFTGQLYRAATEAPYNPSVYSPLFYFVMSLPFRVFEPLNPFLIPRLIIGGSFLMCVLVTVSLTRMLNRHRQVVMWAWLLGLSALLFSWWLLAVRVDFIAVLFGLLSVRLLMARTRWTVLLAGLAAGIAFAFKLNVIAAGVSGVAWLLLGRRYRNAAEFLVAAVAAGAGGYLVFWPFEPAMWSHLFALTTPLVEYRGAAYLVSDLLREPVFLLAASALPFVLRRRDQKGQLLLLYGASTILLALPAILHPGTTVNHFFEALFVAVPFAGMAAARLSRARTFGPASQILVGGLILACLIKPAVGALHRSVTLDAAAGNVERIALRHLLQGQRVLSMIPGIALLTTTPPVTQPFVLSLLEMAGQFDPRPLSDQIRARAFDLIVTESKAMEPRGVKLLSPAFREAIQSAYVPFCVKGDELFHLPNGSRSAGSLGAGLLALGCTPMRGLQDAVLNSW
jgi:hypothetical protein